MSNQIIGALILGAGYSRRFGSDKRLHNFGGSTVAETTVLAYSKVFDHVRVVIRPEDDSLVDRLKNFSVELIKSENAKYGMGYSLSDGIINTPTNWSFIGLLDMPYIKATTLQTLKKMAIDADHTKIRIIRARYLRRSDWQTHPIGFHSSLYQELAETTGDQGARTILREHSQLTAQLDSNDIGLCKDIDTPSDLP